MDYTEETLDSLIKDASERGKPDLVLYYQGQLKRIREEQKV